MLAPYFSGGSHPAGTIDVPKVLKALGDGPCTVFDSRICYKNLRLIRVLCLTTALVPADTMQAWHVWRSMSKHVEKVTWNYGLWDYEDALKMRDGIRERKKSPKYSFADLICFICLADIFGYL